MSRTFLTYSADSSHVTFASYPSGLRRLTPFQSAVEFSYAGYRRDGGDGGTAQGAGKGWDVARNGRDRGPLAEAVSRLCRTDGGATARVGGRRGRAGAPDAVASGRLRARHRDLFLGRPGAGLVG